MKAVYIAEFGGPENLEIREVPDPGRPRGSQVLVRVHSAGLNRADLLQRRGLYPPPAGYSPNIPGLEFAGEVIDSGTSTQHLAIGDRVFGITAGEAHAELLLIDELLAVRVPDNLDLTAAGAVPEAFITAHDAVFVQAALQSGETLLVHAVASGVGLAGLQIAKTRGAFVIGTSRSAPKLEQCREFGLDIAIDARTTKQFSAAVLGKTGGNGVNVIFDLVGASYFEENLKSLAPKGRLMLVGLTGGSVAEFNLGIALNKRLMIRGTVLRSRSDREKAQAVAAFLDEIVPLFESGAVRPNVDRVFDFHEVRSAHEYLESNEAIGKVVLRF
jgi:putative PIG3 family NAD(P)H quinone oxidoreductase